MRTFYLAGTDGQFRIKSGRIIKLRGRGRKVRQGDEPAKTVDDILARHRVTGILTVTYETETQVIHKRAYRDRPARTEEKRETFVNSEIDPLTCNDTVRCLGWRVYVTNDPALDLNEAVLAYREEYPVERGFDRYKGKVPGLNPLHLCSDKRIKELIRLMSIGLRILYLLECTARTALQHSMIEEKCSPVFTEATPSGPLKGPQPS